MMEQIHSFFMGRPMAPYKVAEYIQAVAVMIKAVNNAQIGSLMWKQLANDLEALAEDVRAGAFSSIGPSAWRSYNNGAPWRRSGRNLRLGGGGG